MAPREIKHTYVSFELKGVDEEARTFEGLASTHELDLQDDIIEPGAYANTLNQWRDSKSRIIPIIDLHNYRTVRSVFGKLEAAEERPEGLSIKGSVVKSDEGDEYLARFKGGYVNGLSIGYEVVRAEYEDREVNGRMIRIRHLKELKLREISAVIWGAQQGALIDTASVKAMLKAFGQKTLDDDQVKELEVLRAEIDALVEASKTAGEEEAPAPERLQALEAHLLELRLASLPV